MNRLMWMMPLICGIFFMSCKKPVVQEDNLLPPDKFGVLFTDTFELETYTDTQDSLVGSGLSVNLLGGMEDPVFGKSYAGFYTQLALPNNNIDLGNVLEFDSIVLSLKFIATYGDVTEGQDLVVKKMTEEIELEKEYYTNQTFQTEATEIGRISNLTKALGDSVNVDGETQVSTIRIKLDDAFGEDLLDQSGSINFSSTEAFQNYLNGIYVGPDESNTGEAIYSVDLADPLSVMTLYYNDTSSLEFLINNQTWAVENFSNDFTSSPIEPYINSSSMNDSLIFVQPMATTKAIIKIPELLNLENIIINKAELVFTEVKSPLGIPFDEDFAAPNLIVAFSSDSAGNPEAVSDQFVSNSYFGGDRQTTTINGEEVGQYKINLTRHYQFIIDDRKQDFGIFILPLPSNRIANRVVFGGGNHGSAPAKLNLTYTKIE